MVKGKNIPVKVFTVISDQNTQLTKTQLDFNLKYSKGLSYYKVNEYQKAIQCFQEAKQLIPKDGPTQFFLEKLNHSILV